jgi:hypothetical protein
MISATAVNVMLPAPNFGPPPPFTESPVFDSMRDLFAGNVSSAPQVILTDRLVTEHSQWASYNLGELIGLRGLWSLAPLLLAFLMFLYYSRSAAAPTRLR